MADYEARLFRANDMLSVVAPLAATNDFDAKVFAARMLLSDIEYIVLTRDGDEIATVRRRRAS